MTNFEYWKEEMLELLDKREYIGVKGGKPILCREIGCANCQFKDGTCTGGLLRWLYEEHTEKPKLTKNERKLCETLNKNCYIARSANDRLDIFDTKPIKLLEAKLWSALEYSILIDERFITDCNFSFIKWEDDEAWSVEELLKLEVEE